jgi:hypothetical protein
VVHFTVKKDANKGPMGQTREGWYRQILEDIKNNEKAGMKSKGKDCEKREETGVFNFINAQGWAVSQHQGGREGLKAPRAISPVGFRTRNHCAGKDQQQFSSKSVSAGVSHDGTHSEEHPSSKPKA